MKNLIAIDIESATGKCDDASLCSFGYYLTDNEYNFKKGNDILVNPLVKRFTVGLNYGNRTKIKFAYTEKEFRLAPRFNSVYNEISTLISDCLVVGFSLSNDIKYLNDACEHYNLQCFDYSFLDVQMVYSLLNPEETHLGLASIAEKYNIPLLNHKSDEDAKVSLLILEKVLNESNLTLKSFIEKYEIVLGHNDKNGYHMCFSKALFKEQYGTLRNKKMNTLIFSEYCNRLENIKVKCKRNGFYNKKVMFSANLINDLSKSLPLLSKLNSLNCKYSNDFRDVDIYITEDKEPTEDCEVLYREYICSDDQQTIKPKTDSKLNRIKKYLPYYKKLSTLQFDELNLNNYNALDTSNEFDYIEYLTEVFTTKNN